jgi:hypothetical protein
VRWTDKLPGVHGPLEVDEPLVEYGPQEVDGLLVVDALSVADGSLVLDKLMLVDGLLVCDELRAVANHESSMGRIFLCAHLSQCRSICYLVGGNGDGLSICSETIASTSLRSM